MARIDEIEAAIEKLSASDLDQLHRRLETLRPNRVRSPQVENWLAQARGAAMPGVTTDDVIALTRGERCQEF